MESQELKDIDVSRLEDSKGGGCFHGEVWISCPHCGHDVDLMGLRPPIKDGYWIIECERCGQIYKDYRG